MLRILIVAAALPLLLAWTPTRVLAPGQGAPTCAECGATAIGTTTTTIPPASGAQVLMGASGNASGNEGPLNNATQYNQVPPMIGLWVTTETQRLSGIAAAGSLSNLRIVLETAPGAGKSWVFTVRVNGAPSGVTCTVANAATSCQDLVHTAAVAPGDRMDYESVPTVTPAVPPRVRFSLRFTPTTADEFILPFGGLLSNATTWMKPFGYQVIDETVNNVAIPTAATVKNLYAYCSTAVAASASRIFMVRIGTGVPTGSMANSTITCTMGAGATTCTDLTHTASVAPGDLLDIQHTITGSPGGNIGCALGLVFDPTTPGTFILGGMLAGQGYTSTSATVYAAINGSDIAYSGAAETALIQQAAQAMTIRGISVELNGFHGASTTETYTLRKNGVDTACTCAISGGVATDCNAPCSVSVADDDLLTTKMVPTTGAPASRDAHVSYSATIP